MSTLDAPEHHLRELLKDDERCAALTAEFDGVLLDFARQRVTAQTMDLLYDLAEAAGLRGKIDAMARGDHINGTEDRAVMHMALRAPEGFGGYAVDGADVVPDVHAVLRRINAFAEAVRGGTAHVGCTGKALRNVISVGIGGSYLGPEVFRQVTRPHHFLGPPSK